MTEESDAINRRAPLEVAKCRRTSDEVASESGPVIVLSESPIGSPERVKIRNRSKIRTVNVKLIAKEDGKTAFNDDLAPYAEIDESIIGGFSSVKLTTLTPGTAPVKVQKYYG